MQAWFTFSRKLFTVVVLEARERLIPQTFTALNWLSNWAANACNETTEITMQMGSSLPSRGARYSQGLGVGLLRDETGTGLSTTNRSGQ